MSTNGSWAAVLHSAKDLRVVDHPHPGQPGKNQVLVEMKRVGICGSDVHYWQHGRIGDFILNSPMVIGHESAGIITAIGEGVDHLQVGDRVALEPGVPCRTCSFCKQGNYNLCPDMQFFATPPVDGSLCHSVLHAADFAFKLPENVSLDEGAMCEPLSVGVYACERAGVKPGDSVLVLGAGPIGLVCALTAKAYGAGTIVITDISEDRLNFAKKLGIDITLSAKDASPQDMSDQVIQHLGKKADVTFECCGFETPTRTGVLATKSNGVLCLIGMGQEEMKLPMFEIIARQVDLRGIFRYRNTYPICISLLESKKLDVMPLITNRYKIDDILEAFETARSDRNAIKVMFEL